MDKALKIGIIIPAVFFAAFVLASKVNAATEVSSTIVTDTTWTLANSPYIVTGNILVNEGVTLTIEPGVDVKFEDYLASNYYGYYIRIDGTLVARGTEEDKITFTSNNIDSHPINWGKIYFSDTSVDWNNETESGSVIEYAIIEYGGKDTSAYLDEGGDSLVGIYKSSPLIQNNILRLSDQDALKIFRGNPSIIGNEIQTGRIFIEGGQSYFTENEITDSEGFYIVDDDETTMPTITKNNIINNQEGSIYYGGLRIDDNSCPIITYNNIVNNSDSGIVFIGLSNVSECAPVISHNNIYSNETFSIILHDATADVDASNNWWGTTDENLISDSIYDKNDDYNLGEVNYSPFLTTPESETPDMQNPVPAVISETTTPSVTTDSNDKQSGKNWKLYKQYREKYKSASKKSGYTQVKNLKKTNFSEFNRLKAIYTQYKGYGSKNIAKLSLKIQNDYKLYKNYKGYKKYRFYKDKVGK